MSDDLKAAFQAVRDLHDGTNEESDATLQRALFRTRVETRRRRATKWVLLPIAAAFVASSAWAGVTGRLHGVLEMAHIVERAEHPTPVAVAVRPSTPEPARAPEPEPEPARAPEPEPSLAPSSPAAVAPGGPVSAAPSPAAAAASPPATSAPVVAAPAVIPPAAAAPRAVTIPVAAAHSGAPGVVANPSRAVDSSASTPTPTPTDPGSALFAEAHQIHFNAHDPARALAAWDKYLAAEPSGRFAPEARYNRAITLVRLGRKSEAQQELAVFANGMYGDYRRADAKALLDALAKDAGQ